MGLAWSPDGARSGSRPRSRFGTAAHRSWPWISPASCGRSSGLPASFVSMTSRSTGASCSPAGTCRSACAAPTRSRPVKRELSATDDSVCAISRADGRTVLFHDRNAMFLRPTDGSPPLRLSEGYLGGRLSPDGRWVLAISEGGDHSFPMLIPGRSRRNAADRSAPIARRRSGSRTREFSVRLPIRPQRFRLLAIDLASGKETEIPIGEGGRGRHLLRRAPLTGRSPSSRRRAAAAFWIVPLGGGAARRFAGSADLEKGTSPVGWTSDGRSLFVSAPGHRSGEGAASSTSSRAGSSRGRPLTPRTSPAWGGS